MGYTPSPPPPPPGRYSVRIIDHGGFCERRIEAVKVKYPLLSFFFLYLLGERSYIAEKKKEIDVINKIRQYEIDNPVLPKIRRTIYGVEKPKRPGIEVIRT